jgi:hypothetical protein
LLRTSDLGPDTGSYYHPLFLRGKPFLADRIPRQEIKGRGPYRPEPFRQEPNFYSLPFLPPTSSTANQQDARASTSGDGQPQAALPLALPAAAPPVLSMLGTNVGLGVLPAGLSLIQPLMAVSTPASGIDAKKAAGLLQATSSLMGEWPATVQQRNEQLTSGLLAPDNTTVMLYAMALCRRQLEEERLMMLQQPYRSAAPIQPRTTMTSSSSGAPPSGAILSTSALLALLQTRHQREQQQVQTSSSLGNVGELGLSNGRSIGNNELDAIGRARLYGSRSRSL